MCQNKFKSSIVKERYGMDYGIPSLTSGSTFVHAVHHLCHRRCGGQHIGDILHPPAVCQPIQPFVGGAVQTG